jgi:hypothetical protein
MSQEAHVASPRYVKHVSHDGTFHTLQIPTSIRDTRKIDEKISKQLLESSLLSQ